jgi:hypothetical protein
MGAFVAGGWAEATATQKWNPKRKILRKGLIMIEVGVTARWRESFIRLECNEHKKIT